MTPLHTIASSSLMYKGNGQGYLHCIAGCFSAWREGVRNMILSIPVEIYIRFLSTRDLEYGSENRINPEVFWTWADVLARIQFGYGHFLVSAVIAAFNTLFKTLFTLCRTIFSYMPSMTNLYQTLRKYILEDPSIPDA
ncbi:hypothetical protein F4604DRAFT_1681901 [Suillus subluteus]|nr:hypothetical protein F4604DRAFT_1681901 [Suillus subluteus]